MKKVSLPLSDEVISSLHAGDAVLLSGTMYTARDAAHKRLHEMMAKGEKLPFDLDGALIYYVGPTPAQPGQVIGSAGPTTRGRMDAYTPELLEKANALRVGPMGLHGKTTVLHLNILHYPTHIAGMPVAVNI